MSEGDALSHHDVNESVIEYCNCERHCQEHSESIRFSPISIQCILSTSLIFFIFSIQLDILYIAVCYPLQIFFSRMYVYNFFRTIGGCDMHDKKKLLNEAAFA